MEDKTSRALIYLNTERIILKQQQASNESKRISNRINKVCKYLKNGNLSYAISSIKNRNYKSSMDEGTDACDFEYLKDKKIAVYTVIFGKYDGLLDPLYITPNCDYYVITNQEFSNLQVWNRYNINTFRDRICNMTNQEQARFFKTHPHLLFQEYEYSIFVDGNVQIVADMRPIVAKLKANFIGIHQQPGRDCIYQEAEAVIALGKANRDAVYKQVNQYRREGFPEHFGLFQTNVLVRNHNNDKCVDLMEKWWSEMEMHTKRDQLSLTYSLWKLGLCINDVSVLGANTALNPRFFVHKHQ